jgi:hypothetical protein
MTALLRYHAALLWRSRRWLPPVLLYATLVVIVSNAGQPLADGLTWSAAVLLPAAAWLTRLALTAEPAAARACVSVAGGGPRRAHLAALLNALAWGAGLGLAGSGFELVRCRLPAPGQLAHVLATGIGAALTCLLVGAALATLCNPPLVRRPAAGMLATTAAVVLALTSNISPASAALRGSGATSQGASWLPGLPLGAAVALMIIAWAASAAAARRG